MAAASSRLRPATSTSHTSDSIPVAERIAMAQPPTVDLGMLAFQRLKGIEVPGDRASTAQRRNARHRDPRTAEVMPQQRPHSMVNAMAARTTRSTRACACAGGLADNSESRPPPAVRRSAHAGSRSTG